MKHFVRYMRDLHTENPSPTLHHDCGSIRLALKNQIVPCPLNYCSLSSSSFSSSSSSSPPPPLSSSSLLPPPSPPPPLPPSPLSSFPSPFFLLLLQRRSGFLTHCSFHVKISLLIHVFKTLLDGAEVVEREKERELLQGSWVQFPAPIGGSQPSTPPLPGNQMPSSDFHRQQAHRWYTLIHAGKTLIQVIK